jgi:hypothetical protein
MMLGLTPAAASSRTVGNVAVKTLTVTIVNEGPEDEPLWGHVSSEPDGIDCPPSCSSEFESGTTVELSADPVEGYALDRWNALPNADGCDQEETCTLTIDDGDLNPSVEASFHPAAELQAVTAGPGTLAISPVQPGASAVCKVDAQQVDPESSCIQRYVTGTRVTLTARPGSGGPSFVGWSDYACSRTSLRCTVVLAAGERYITARFSPVRLTIQAGAFGSVVVKPKPGGTCTFDEDTPTCAYTYPSGTVVTLRREHSAPGKYWIGACDGNQSGTLDKDVCRLRLYGNELVAAGLDEVTAIPPPLGSGFEISRTGRGNVTGDVNGTRILDCGRLCSVSGLSRYDQIRLTATASRGSHFLKWSDGSQLKRRIIALSGLTRMKATFANG